VTHPTDGGLSRRELLKKTSQSALAGLALPYVHIGENNTIQLALVGCGGRGTGAAINALSTRSGPIKLVAMADVFPEQLAKSHKQLEKEVGAQKESGGPIHKEIGGQFDVPEGRRFIGFDAYQKAMGCLRAGDVVILTTPPAFRWVHFAHAIKKGLNVFMEKPVTVDGPSTRRMLQLADDSEKRNLKVGVGLMCRHCTARHELFDRIKSGMVGELTLLQAYRMTGPAAKEFSLPKPPGISELLYQVQRFHSFLWASGGAFSDFMIHNIDECCWMKDAWPVRAQASGGRHYRGNYIDQNFDSYSVEYTFADGTKLLLEGRNIPGCHQEFASYAHGTKGLAIISTSGHTPAKCRIYKGHNPSALGLIWKFPPPEPDPYQLEWDHLIEAIRQDRHYNEVRRGAEASLVTAMGRMAAHTGQVVTREQMLASDHEFAPDVDKLTFDSPAPVRADKDGKYPVPQPGIKKKREY
jgi:predicted dehydrogenase